MNVLPVRMDLYSHHPAPTPVRNVQTLTYLTAPRTEHSAAVSYTSNHFHPGQTEIFEPSHETLALCGLKSFKCACPATQKGPGGSLSEASSNSLY